MRGSKRLIIAFFENPAAAEVAARAMRGDWRSQNGTSMAWWGC
jgi:hypothetical protein